MANISEEKWIEMLEKKADGTYIAKYPKVKSKSGVTFDEHLDDIAAHQAMAIGNYIGDGNNRRTIILGFTPSMVIVKSNEVRTSTKTAFITTSASIIEGTTINSGDSSRVLENGFEVYNPNSNKLNINNMPYVYVAFK